LNLGSNNSASCGRSIESAVARVADASDYSNVVNGRFKGGYITRHYGEPKSSIHALQLEIAQRAYMNESRSDFDEAKAARLRDTLSEMLRSYLAAARQ
jgi:N-formylglutamate amidohydrolase